MGKGRRHRLENPWVWAAAMAGAFAVLALVSWRLPRRAMTVSEADAAKLDHGPASYFHHFYDPDGLLGPVGSIDLALENFERDTTHAIVVAAFRSLPGADPDFTMKLADKWRPGARGADNGVILFVFTGDRRIRAEVGYGLEDVLPDAEMLRILDEAAAPAFRSGDFVAGLDAATQRISERCRAATSGGRPARTTAWLEIKRGLRAAPYVFSTGWSFFSGASLGIRLGVSLLVVLAGALIAALVVDATIAAGAVARAIRGRVAGDGVRVAGEAVMDLILKALRVAALVLALGIAGTYFFAGSGHFGGGGVDVFW